MKIKFRLDDVIIKAQQLNFVTLKDAIKIKMSKEFASWGGSDTGQSALFNMPYVILMTLSGDEFWYIGNFRDIEIGVELEEKNNEKA